MPPDLSPNAQAAWNLFSGELVANGLIAAVDRQALRLASESVALYIEAMDDIAANGITFATAKGFRLASPSVAIRNQAWAQIWKFCREFGLTVSARSGLKVETKQENDDRVSKILGLKVAS